MILRGFWGGSFLWGDVLEINWVYLPPGAWHSVAGGTESHVSQADDTAGQAQAFHVLALVESVRTQRGPRQRVVAHLGELRSGQRSGWAQLARGLDKKDRPQPWLF